VRLTCEYILKVGWAAQVAAAASATPADAPRLTIDAAMLLVDQALANDDSKAACTREEVEAAFGYLTNPRVEQAVWVDNEKSAIVVTSSLKDDALKRVRAAIPKASPAAQERSG